MRIACDLDGVIANTICEVLRICRELGRVKDNITEEDWNAWFPEIKGITPDFIAWIFKNTNVFRTARPYPEAINALSSIYELSDIQIDIVTDRFHQEGLHKDTLNWLEYHNIFGYSDVHFIHRKDKALFVSAIGYDLLIEDNIETAQEVIKLDIPTYLIARPWNKNIIPISSKLVRTTWEGVALYVQAMQEVNYGEKEEEGWVLAIA